MTPTLFLTATSANYRTSSPTRTSNRSGRRFGTREQVNSRFAQLAALNNALPHARPPDAVTTKDGEAALLLWFAGTLSGTPQLEASGKICPQGTGHGVAEGGDEGDGLWRSMSSAGSR